MGGLQSKRAAAKKANLNKSKAKDSAGNLHNPDIFPNSASTERVTQEHVSLAKSKDNKSSTPKLMQQATPAGGKDALDSDVLLQDQQQQHKETTEVPLQTIRTVAPCEMQTKVPCKDASPQVKFSFWSKAQQQLTSRLPASKNQPPVRLARKVNKSPSQKSDCVLSHANEASASEAYDTVDLNITTKPTTAELPATREPPDCSRQMSSQPKAQVNKENAPHIDNSVTSAGVFTFSAKSESSCTKAAKKKLRPKQAKKIKAQPDDGGKSSQQTAEETKSSWQQHDEPQQRPQPNTDENIWIQTIKASQVQADSTAALDTGTGLQVSPLQDTAKSQKKGKSYSQMRPKNTRNVTVKEGNRKSCQVEEEAQESTMTSVVTLQSRWPPFTVCQSCSHKARCRHNPGTGLPTNVQKWLPKPPEQSA